MLSMVFIVRSSKKLGLMQQSDSPSMPLHGEMMPIVVGLLYIMIARLIQRRFS